MKYLFFYLISTSFLLAFEALETSYYYYPLTEETNLLEKQETIQKHFLDSKNGYFQGALEVKIYYRIFKVKDEKGSIVISSGRTESLGKYKELIYDLNANGFSVYILDHRGQGDSGRLTKDPQMGHVNDFMNYVRDLHTFIEKKVLPDQPQNLFLVGHSMGGAIAGLYIENYPKVFDAALLSSPMMQPTIGGALISGFMCNALTLKKNEIPSYAPGTESYDNENRDFETNQLTHSKIRYKITEKTFEVHQREKVGGPSLHWVVEACKASKTVVEEADKIKIPILVLQAGEDAIVNPAPQEKLCKRADKFCSGYQVPGAYHELFVESDMYRTKALTALLNFFNANLKKVD